MAKKRRSPSARKLILPRPYRVEPVERRLFLAITQTFVPTAESFTWDAFEAGRFVIDSPVSLRSLLSSQISATTGRLFLDLDGVVGGTTTKGHEGQFELEAFEFGLDRKRAGTDIGGPDFTRIHVLAEASRGTTGVIDRVQSGTHIRDALLVYEVTSPSGTIVPVLNVRLLDVRIESYRTTKARSGGLAEEYTLGFRTVSVDVSPNGGATFSYSWDVATQGRAVNDLPLEAESIVDSSGFVALTDSAFLRLDGIPGSATQKGFEGHIPVAAFEWSVNATPAGPDFSAVHVVARTARQSPRILQYAISGQSIANAELTVNHFGTSGIPLWTLNMDLDEVEIRSHRVTSVLDGTVLEEFTLSFSAYQMSHSGSWPTASTAWDLRGAGGTVSDPSPGEREVLFEKAPVGGNMLFLKLDGIDGEVTQKGLERQIEVLDFDWGADRAGAPLFNRLHVVAPTSIASPKIMEAEYQRNMIPSATLSIYGPSGVSSAPLQRILLTGVKVDAYRVNSLHHGTNVDEFQLSFETESYQDLPSGVLSSLYLPGAGATFANLRSVSRSLLDSKTPGGTSPDALAFLSLSGIPGEVTQKGYENTIDVLSFEWGQGSRESLPYFHELHVVVAAGRSTPALMSAVANGGVIAGGNLRTLRANSAGIDFRCYQLSFEQAAITSYQVNATAAYLGRLTDEITIRFSAFALTATSSQGQDVTYAQSAPVDFARSGRATQESVLERGSLATSMFLSLAGIPGSVTQKGQEGKIEIDTFEWGVDQAGQVHFTELTFVAPSSRATPKLLTALAQGSVISNGTFIVGRGNPATGVVTYFYNLAFAGAQVSSIRSSSRLDGSIVDEFTLRIDTATLTMAPSANSFTFDIASNATTLDHSPPDRPLTRPGPMVPLPFAWLELDGVNGGATTKGHEGDFQLLGFEWRADRAFTGSIGGPDFGELRVVTPVNRGTPTLLQHVSASPSPLAGRIQLYRPGPSGSYVLDQTIDFEHAGISSYSQTTALDGSLIEEFTIAFDLSPDLVPPQLVSQSFAFETGQSLHIVFTEEVGASLSVTDFSLLNLSTSQNVPLDGYAIQAIGGFAYTLSPPPGTSLPDAVYRLTINPGGITDDSGNSLLASSIPGPLEFHVLAGDADRNRTVDFSDLLILAQNYGQSGRTFSQGNFDYSAGGQVDFADLLLLAQRYGTSVLVEAPTRLRGRGMRVNEVLA